MRFLLILIVPIFFSFISCGGSNESSHASKVEVKGNDSAKEYADLIMGYFRTNRDMVIAQEFMDPSQLDMEDLNITIASYFQSVLKGDWIFEDVYESDPSSRAKPGFDYVWYDRRGRLAMQIYILPKEVENRYMLEKLEFRSRLDILKSLSFPGGEIANFKEVTHKKK